MYGRAERSINLTPREDLGPYLGPTSYNVKFEFKKCTTGGYAPFGSLGQRNTIFTSKRDEIPSPSAYSPKSSCTHIKGGSSMKNTEVRFGISKSVVPGPGTYNVRAYWPGSEHDPCDLLMPYLLHPEKPKIPIRYVERTFPSIVATLDAHGYVAGPDGQLRPQSGPMRFCCNEMNSSNLESCQRYQGCKWSSRTDYRKTFCPPNDYPGPGTYFTSINDEWIRLITRGLQQNLTNSKHVLNVPRFIEKHVRDAKHENLPPPGLYFADESQPRKINPHRPPFATSAPRFPPGDLTIPGPGTYNINRDKFDSLCTLRNQKRIPFLSSDTRMSKEKTEPTPGPFAYKIPGMTEKMLLRLKRKEVGLKVPFDSSSERVTMTAAKRCEGPGPHDYYPKPQPKCRREIPEKTSISRKNSDSRAPIERERCPPPTTYDVTMAFKALKDHRSFRASRRDQSNEAFLCSSSRFTKYTEGVAGFIANPGPGAYCVKRDPQPKCGTFRRTEERFRDVDNGQPGPADYKLDPAVGSSVYIRTFNVTLRRRTKSAPAHVKH